MWWVLPLVNCQAHLTPPITSTCSWLQQPHPKYFLCQMLLLLEAINLHTLGTSSQYAGLLTVRLVMFLLQQILFQRWNILHNELHMTRHLCRHVVSHSRHLWTARSPEKFDKLEVSVLTFSLVYIPALRFTANSCLTVLHQHLATAWAHYAQVCLSGMETNQLRGNIYLLAKKQI